VTLFNHRQFFAAHDALEKVWLSSVGRDRDFYRGLIQAAVACYHWSRGNLAGAMTLSRSSSRYLKKYPPRHFGLDVGGFLARYTELFAWLRRHPTRYDARLIPVFSWTTPPPR
jgi:predicted metal-dependent hydrolase